MKKLLTLILLLASLPVISQTYTNIRYLKSDSIKSWDNGRDVYIGPNLRTDTVRFPDGSYMITSPSLFGLSGVIDLATQFGADTTGATDISTALRRAMVLNKPIYFRKGYYRLDSTVVLPDSMFLFGAGNATNIVLTNNVAGLRPHARTTIRDITFRGTRNLGGTTAQDAIVCDSLQRQILIDNCNFHAIAGSAILIQNTSDENIISNCHMDSCAIGVETTTTGDYNQLCNSLISFGGTGVDINSGNFSITGGVIYYNTSGIIVRGGSNNGHAVATSVMLNHNGTPINCVNNSLGYKFISCMIYDGTVTITNSANVSISDCDIDIDAFTVSASTNISLLDNKLFSLGVRTQDTSGVAITYPSMGKWKVNTLSVDSAIYEAGIKTITATAYTASNGDNTILCNATGGAITVTLPPATAAMAGRILTIKKIDASVNSVTIAGNASETIDGSNTQPLALQWEYLTIKCNGSAWFIIGND
jgi:hypothetical protein